MISAIYASISALIIVRLSLNVIKARRLNKVSIGDGDFDNLKIAMAAQSNAIEYIPIALILLFALEANQANNLLIHVFGLALLVGRIIHAQAMANNNLNKRVLGMRITVFTLIGLAVGNLIYVPYAQFFKF